MRWQWTVRMTGEDVSYLIATLMTEPELPAAAPGPPEARAPAPRAEVGHATPLRPVEPYAPPGPTLVDDPTPVTARDPNVEEAPPIEAPARPTQRAEGLRLPPAPPPDPAPASGRALEAAPLSRNESPGRALRRDAPPPILPPTDLYEVERCWTSTETLSTLRAGCCSHRGPPWTWADKENEDFAFAAVRRARNGEPWALAGVCDGVGNSTWSERGAKHAAAAFVDIVTLWLRDTQALAHEMQRPETKRDFAMAFRRRVQDLLEEDARLLFEGRYLHPSWKEDFYERTFLRGKDAVARRAEWLQTTLLAAALGPQGGFALLLGDGFVRVDRYQRGKRVRRKGIPLQGDAHAPERRVSLAITVEDVEQSLRGVLPDQSERVDVILATDGVSKSPRHGLDERVLEGEDDCRRFLDELARRPKGEVESDNMSVAFASRETKG